MALFPLPRIPVFPSVSVILRQCAHKYASVSTYLDEGRVTFSYQSSRGEFSGEHMTFRTWFKRGTGIRLQFTQPGADDGRSETWQAWKSSRVGYVLWSSWTPREVDRPGLSAVFDATVGMADVVRVAIANWVGVATKPSLFDLRKSSVSWSARLDDRGCFLVSGHLSDGTRESLWIDERSYLIRRCRVEVPSTLDGKPTNEVCTVDLKPQSGISIEDESCRFVPPHTSSHHRSRTHRKHKRHRKG